MVTMDPVVLQVLLVIAAVVGAVLAFGRDDGEPLTVAQYAELVQSELRDCGFRGTIEFDAEGNCLNIVVDGFTGKMSLANLVAEYNAAHPSQRREFLARTCRIVMTQASATIPELLATARTNILPSLQSSFYYEQMRCIGRAEPAATPDEVAARSFADGLDVGLVYDMPDMRMALFDSHVATWGLTFDQALAIAHDNLLRQSDADFVQMTDGYYQGPWDDAYGATRLILTEKVRKLSVKGDHVAAIPNRDMLIVTGSDDQDGLARAVAAVEQGVGGARPISARLFRLAGENWVPFVPDGPLAVRCRALRTHELAEMHAVQLELVPKVLAAEGRDLYMVKVDLARNEATGDLMSYFLWTDAPNLLVPATTHVVFNAPSIADEGHVLGPVPWEAVEGVLTAKLKRTEFYPPLYEVQGFPTSDELAQLRSVAS